MEAPGDTHECVQTYPFQEYSFHWGNETLGESGLDMVYNNIEHKSNVGWIHYLFSHVEGYDMP